MEEPASDKVCNLIDEIRGQLVYSEDDDDVLESALLLLKHTVFSADEMADIKEHFKNALRRVRLSSKGSWFHKQLLKAYDTLFPTSEILSEDVESIRLLSKELEERRE